MVEVRVGCSSWTSPAWSGRFYPEGIPDGERLAYYARWFDAVEVDTTYYRPPSPFMVRAWDRKTPENFLFTIKMWRDLLDPKKPEKEGEAAGFVETAQLLGGKLGAILLQFAPWFRAPKTPGTGTGAFLERRLASLPEGPRYAVELREAGWFRGDSLAWLRRTLEERGVASCWSSLTYVDVPALRTADWGYLRFIGDHTTIPAEVHGEIRVDRLEEIRRWVRELRGADLRSALAFFNNHFAGYAPFSVNHFRVALDLPPIEFPAPVPTDADVEPPHPPRDRALETFDRDAQP
ncbi:MAG: DUF72 domain-containing protein [Thermoplasmata archaeon]|nr:DUF72 domain-containing protein [Thermoplasmata archaeon]